MTPMSIKFLGPDDYFCERHELIEDAAIELGIAPAVLSSGRPGVLIKITDGDGDTVVIPTTARLFVTMAKMIEARYPDLMKD